MLNKHSSNKIGGGVGIYLNNNLDFKLRPGVRFSKVPKTVQARKVTRKAPENIFVFLKTRENFGPFSPDNLQELASSRKTFLGIFFTENGGHQSAFFSSQTTKVVHDLRRTTRNARERSY